MGAYVITYANAMLINCNPRNDKMATNVLLTAVIT